MRVLAVITARGGSKGVPRKNLRPVAGKPLIVWTIERALEVEDRLHRIVVSTDDEEIAAVARQSGADVPFIRPAELAEDETDSLPVVQHAVGFVEEEEGTRLDWVLLLQPTSPLRAVEDIRATLDLAAKGKCDSVIAVEHVVHTHPMLLKTIEGERLEPYGETPRERVRRQDCYPDVYVNNGAIYLTRRDTVMEQNLLLGAIARPYIMPSERSLDIDTEFDLRIADAILST
jgi:CMP-N-acetylneuraminic acid synthetase